MRFRLTLVFIVALFLFVPPAALAAGGSGINQYVEQVPGAGGNHPESGGGGPGGGSSSLPPGAQQALNADGSVGRATAHLAAATAPNTGHKKTQGGSKGNTSESANGTPGVSADGTTSGVASGDGGVGILLPLILGGSLLGAIAYMLLRRRRSGGGPPGALPSRGGGIAG